MDSSIRKDAMLYCRLIGLCACVCAGELTVFCKGPTKNSFCELRDHKDGTFLLIVKPQDVGVHALHVRYNDIDVPGERAGVNASR